MKRELLTASLLLAGSCFLSGQASVHVQPSNLQGPRELQPQTASAVVKNYVESWQTLSLALQQDNPGLLDHDFAGDARDKLASTIQQQVRDGLKTSYKDTSHNLQIVFYSPEGLSIELVDDVEYDVEVLDKDKSQGKQHIRARYVAVLTPSETRWRVREFEAVPAQ